MFTHQLCHPVPPPSLGWFDSATGRIPPTVLYCWWWCLLSRSESLLSFRWNSMTTISLGANDSVVTGHAWAHSIPYSSRRDTEWNDGFTAIYWHCMTDKDQITGRRLRPLAVLSLLWHYLGQIALVLVQGLHGWNILSQEKKILFGWKVVRLKPEQPDRRLCPCKIVSHHHCHCSACTISVHSCACCQ